MTPRTPIPRRPAAGVPVPGAFAPPRPLMVLGALTAALWLGGCATSADPHEGGFVSGVVGIMGGGYQQRVDERQGAYQGELNAQQRLQAEARAVEQERAAVRRDLNQANARLAAIERSIAAQRARIKAAAGAGASGELRRLDQAQAQVTRTKGALRGVRPDRQPVGDLKAQSAAIQRDLDQIDRVVASVSGKGF